MDFSAYSFSLYAIYALLVMVAVQGLVASVAHRAQASYVPGVVDPTLGPGSFVFRSHRTLMNSIENVPFMMGLVFLAILSGFSPDKLGVLCWIFVLARLAHMVTYYLVATHKNPSLRSVFYIVGFLAQLVLMVMVGVDFL
ncbi:MAPEG family protein [uncultured Cohaesibacter sp.]|uniref:MAPEG family protein n=1 Tax=uncultured Cohaesibacter sp. TaxID=1002546 RepID=UPI002930BF84|nr:MAPEG family protein [uncultured Cohaesibacter sp.]